MSVYLFLTFVKRRPKMKTSGQFGEYIVAAELCRRGIVPVTFSNNMPGFDVLALSRDGKKTCRIQVKTIVSGQWSFDARDYLVFSEKKLKNGIQEAVGRKSVDGTDYIVFVVMGNASEKDQFYILPIDKLQKIIRNKYTSFLKLVGGKRSRNPNSFHTAIDKEDVKRFKDDWSILPV